MVVALGEYSEKRKLRVVDPCYVEGIVWVFYTSYFFEPLH